MPNIDDIITTDLQAGRADFAHSLALYDTWMLDYAQRYNERYTREHPWRTRWHHLTRHFTN